MGGDLLMSAKGRRRKVEFEGIVEGRMTIPKASDRLGLSYRQCRRSYKRFREEGDVGLVQMDGAHHEWFGPGQPWRTRRACS